MATKGGDVFTKNEASGQIFATTLAQINLKATNMAREWRMWLTQFKIFIRASNLEDASDQRKVALLLHHLGSGALDVFCSFNKDIDKVKYEELVSEFDAYFIPEINIAMERHTFLMCQQQPEQTIQEYVKLLKNLSLSCEFGSLRESLVRDVFTCGLSAKMENIRERLLSEGGIELDKAVNIAKNMAAAKENAKSLQTIDESEPARNCMKRKDYKMKQANKQSNCTKCGQIHRSKCPALEKKCHNCGKIGHFEKMCFWKEEENLFIGALPRKTTTLAEWNIEMDYLNEDICRICLKHGTKLNWHIEICEFSGITYKNCYYKYTQLKEYDSDSYLTNLCEMCANELKNAHMLFEKALESFNTLQTVFTTKQLEINYSAVKCGTQDFDDGNCSVDDKTIIEIEHPISVSPFSDIYAIKGTENEINGCRQILMNEDISAENTHFVDIQCLEQSGETTLEAQDITPTNTHFVDIQHLESSGEITLEPQDITPANTHFVDKQHLEQSGEITLEPQDITTENTHFVGIQHLEPSGEITLEPQHCELLEISELCDTNLSKASTTKNTARKRRKCLSRVKISSKTQVEECGETKFSSGSTTKKACNKRKKIKSLTATSLETNHSESCETKSLTPAAKPKKSREKYLLMCSYCSLKVEGRYKLAHHEAAHTEDRKRTEICPKCGIKFYDKLGLTEHIKIHDENRKKNHKCEFCEKTFYNRGSLNVHRRIHLGLMIKCQICPKEFYRQIDLDKHLLTHSSAPIQRNVEQNKYAVQCEYCNKSVLTCKWKSHVAIHVGEPQVKCKLCDKTFLLRSSCAKHLRKFHLKKSSEYENCIHYFGDKKSRVSTLMMKQQMDAQRLSVADI